MKVFFIRWGSDTSLQVARYLKEAGIEISYWLGPPCFEKGVKELFPQSIFHDMFKATYGEPAPGFDLAAFPPLGQDILSRLCCDELKALGLMSRKVFFASQPLNQRRRAFNEQSRYWLGLFKQLKPEAVCFLNPPHGAYTYIIYAIAKLLGVDIVMFDWARIPDRILLMRLIEEGPQALKREIAKMRESGERARIEDLTAQVKNYYHRMTASESPYLAYLPAHQRPEIRPNYLPKALPALKKIFQKDGLKKARGYFSLKRWQRIKQVKKNQKRMKQTYQGLQSLPDFSQKFIFAALHYQPERATNPMGGVFDDQLLMLDMLSRAAPSGWLVFVKEHPSQWVNPAGCWARFEGYYQEILKNDNVRLMPVETESAQLLKYCQAAATVGGTVAMEALLQEKPVLIFGEHFLNLCPAFFKINNLKSCQEALQRIAQGFRPTRQQGLDFLLALDRTCIKSRLRERHLKDSRLTQKECARNMAQALIKELAPASKLC